MNVWFSTTPSPIGPLLLVKNERGLSSLTMEGQPGAPAPQPSWRSDPARLAVERAQLGEYFAGVRTRFDLVLAPEGTPFQMRVWEALLAIPYATTTTYAALARSMGMPRAARAVGAANARNPLSIVVPCHRVIGAAGDLTGYAGGIARKKWLLAHEHGRAPTLEHMRARAELCGETESLSLINTAPP